MKKKNTEIKYKYNKIKLYIVYKSIFISKEYIENTCLDLST